MEIFIGATLCTVFRFLFYRYQVFEICNYCSTSGELLHHIWLTCKVLSRTYTCSANVSCFIMPVQRAAPSRSLTSGVGRVFASMFSKLCGSFSQVPSVKQNASSQGTGKTLPPSPPAVATGCSTDGVSVEAAEDVGDEKGIPLPMKDSYPKVRVVGDEKASLRSKRHARRRAF